MPHILIVCTANICRSPVGEGLIRHRLEKEELLDGGGWTVSSAGTWAVVARPPSRNSVLEMGDRGIDIKQNRATIVSKSLLEEADLTLCMETHHVEALHAEFPQFADKIILFTEIVGRQYSINDPYGGPRYEYQIMVREIEKLLKEGWVTMLRMAWKNAGKRQQLTNPE